jgi:signal transduction histidine kinase/ActR/RegA family two-component response regulator
MYESMGCAGQASGASVRSVQFNESLEAEQARFIHRSVPNAALGSLFVVSLIVIVFRDVVPERLLYAWLGAFVVLTILRVPGWLKFRRVQFGTGTSRRWLLEATMASFASGVLWGVGSLFLFPEGQLTYHYTFAVALVFMAVACLFSYGPHYPTFLAFFLPSMVPGVIGMAAQGEPQQNAFAVGLTVMSIIVLWSRRSFNRMFMDSMRLRFENLELISELTVQKEAAEAANLAKSRFLAAASHDLRQPIHALNLYLGAFGQIQLPRHASLLLGKVRQCAIIMDEMFRTLLDVSKLDAGAVKPQIGVFALAPLFARTRLEFEPQARAKGIELHVLRCSAFAKSDPVLVERILRNLVSNAVRYTDSGRVVVGCRRHRGALRISVYDTGVGIDSEEQALVFEEFYQVANRERDRSKGLGLGLAIVDRLARLLEAPVLLRSRLGHGSLFAFDLQRAEPVELPAIRLNRDSVGNRDLTGTLVVLVDDEELILDAAQTLLKQWNCTVIAATSGREALRQLAGVTRPPDVVICDYRLRENEDGVGVVAALRNEFNADIPALLITGDTDPAQIRAIAASGLAVLHKPLREEELNAAICALRAPAQALKS